MKNYFLPYSFYRFIPNPADRENDVYPGSGFFILDHGGSGSQGQTGDPGSEPLAKKYVNLDGLNMVL
jgi:hypothetical protein